ncbi:diguanylate cyclase domain-containing protein [Methylorubrum extorquens]|uniref:diguanylate cyclase domain-containing protein n=1 Tax=Methylorubrum extorquens TaxID=408 RepID=UPI000162982F|nr:diguanylate cyclase [Methylorubrum extorquens]ABY32918.1 GGDEF family protein [Methylorubrum extorquens PA1]KQP86158.1 diguanylate cyclase [Methylobacterium sp. Leaf119]WIU39505.1 GGDEF domain-containing protein [Methylorubrum extorquens]
MGAEKKPPGIVNLGPDACLVRLGSEVFVLLVPERSSAEARWLADEIHYAVARVDDPPAWAISLGVSAVEPGETDVSAAIEGADRSLCRAKAQGRDRAAA